MQQLRPGIHQNGGYSSEYFTGVTQGNHQTDQRGASQRGQVGVRTGVTGQLHQKVKQSS